MRKATTLLSTLLLIAFGCVIIPSEHTIDAHIVVDVNIVERQIGDINDYIAGETAEFPDLEPVNGAEPETWLQKTRDFLAPVRPVYAQEQNAPQSAPALRKAAEQRRARKPKLDALKEKACLGENNRGYVELRPSDYLKNAEKKNEAQRLVGEENQDRKTMYKELAKLNKKSVSTIESISALDLLKRAKPGELFQLPPKGKYFDEFKASAAGKRLGEACAPGAWVTIK